MSNVKPATPLQDVPSVSMFYSVNIIETNVLGAVAFHAKCQHCKWQSKRYDGKRGQAIAKNHAKRHGAIHAAIASPDFFESQRGKRALLRELGELDA